MWLYFVASSPRQATRQEEPGGASYPRPAGLFRLRREAEMECRDMGGLEKHGKLAGRLGRKSPARLLPTSSRAGSPSGPRRPVFSIRRDTCYENSSWPACLRTILPRASAARSTPLANKSADLARRSKGNVSPYAIRRDQPGQSPANVS